MPNKDWDKLNSLDQLIRQTLSHLGMSDGTFLKIEYIYGFEKFNTRPYHNYENWAGGYRITDEENNIRLEREDLDDAIKQWAALVPRVRAGEAIPIAQRHWNIQPTTEAPFTTPETPEAREP